jgi:acetolactate synthase I/II/III large subunit
MHQAPQSGTSDTTGSLAEPKVQQLTGGQIVAEYLIREGVTHVFGIPGHGNTALLDAFVDRRNEISVLPAMHEQGAAHMADGFCRAGGKIAAVCTSIGPGATNTLTGIATAFADSIPQLVLTGGVHTYMMNHGILQEVDRPHGANFPRMAEPVVKRWWQPSRVDQLPQILHQAFNAMREGRPGPVLLDIPQDLQAEYAEVLLPIPSKHRALCRAQGDPAAIEEAAKLLAAAQRPVILAGGGVIASEASEALVALAEHLGAHVTVTFMGKGAIPEDHDLYAWPCGDMGSIPGNASTRQADVLLAIGTKFSDRITSSYRRGVTFNVPPTKIVQIDLDGFEIGKNYPVEVGIVGDARATLAALLTELRERSAPFDYRNSARFQDLQKRKAEWEEHLRPMRTSDHVPMTISRALWETRRAIPRDTIVVTDSSNPQNQAYNEFPVYGPRQHITAGGFSGIGFAIPASIGAKLAQPNRPVVCICGDGSFLQTAQELAAAAMQSVPVVFLILNNSGWEAIKNLQKNLFGNDREIISAFRYRDGRPYSVDASAVSRGLGVSAVRVDDPGTLAAAVQAALCEERPTVIEAMCASEFPWSKQHPTGWWDITVPAYLTDPRKSYEAKRGF